MSVTIGWLAAVFFLGAAFMLGLCCAAALGWVDHDERILRRRRRWDQRMARLMRKARRAKDSRKQPIEETV